MWPPSTAPNWEGTSATYKKKKQQLITICPPVSTAALLPTKPFKSKILLALIYIMWTRHLTGLTARMMPFPRKWRKGWSTWIAAILKITSRPRIGTMGQLLQAIIRSTCSRDRQPITLLTAPLSFPLWGRRNSNASTVQLEAFSMLDRKNAIPVDSFKF